MDPETEGGIITAIKILSEFYARPQEVIRCFKKNPRTGNVLKSFCEKHCPERKTGCRPGRFTTAGAENAEKN